MDPCRIRTGAALLAALMLAGCAGTASSLNGASTFTPARTQTHPPSCTPTVWASSVGSNAVYGYTAANTAPCVTLTGPYNGINLSAPIALALSVKPQWLYVADLSNDRIVVFTYQGVFVKAWTTNLSGQQYQPWGVCVSRKGIVGVGNRQFNNTGAAGNVEFFTIGTANNGGPTGWATGQLISDAFCAFDKKGDFFVDGTATGGGQEIAYLPKADVNLAGQTLSNSGQGSASFWVGMYSRIDSPADNTLSVGTSVGNSVVETVDNWKITGPPTGPLVFHPLPAYTLTGYPSTTDAVYQLAPSSGGSLGTLYVSDFGAGAVLESLAGGGAVASYNSVGTTVGVTTQPTGQY